MCTGIKIDYNMGSVMGRTMDFEVPVGYNALYLPRNYNIGNDLLGNQMITKYKALGICFEDRDPLKDGVNEHGLVGITNTFTGFNLYDNKVDPEKINISSLNFLNYVLGNYKSIEELIQNIDNIHMSSKDFNGERVISPDFHYMFTDTTKRCIVVEPKKKKLLVYENPYNVMTNSPGFESHVRRLVEHMELESLEDFNASKNLPGGYDPFSRFIKSFYLTKMNVDSESRNEAFSHFYNILGAMVMPEGFVRNKKYNETTFTRYICGYDTFEKILTVKSHKNPTVYQLSFNDIKEVDKRQAFPIRDEFKAENLI